MHSLTECLLMGRIWTSLTLLTPHTVCVCVFLSLSLFFGSRVSLAFLRWKGLCFTVRSLNVTGREVLDTETHWSPQSKKWLFWSWIWIDESLRTELLSYPTYHVPTWKQFHEAFNGHRTKKGVSQGILKYCDRDIRRVRAVQGTSAIGLRSRLVTHLALVKDVCTFWKDLPSSSKDVRLHIGTGNKYLDGLDGSI